MPIDIHSHYVPQSLIEAVRSRGSDLGVRVIEPPAGGIPALEFSYGFRVRPFFPKLVESFEQRRAWLDAHELDRQFVATWPDIYGYGLPDERCAAWHRTLNDTLAQWCADHASHFSFVASVPLPAADAAARELERVVASGAVAVMVPANVENKNIGELSLDPLWAQAERLRLPVIVHPVMSVPSPRAAKFGLAQSIHYTFDTTLAAGSLIFSGVLDRFPNLTLVLSHGGGAYPYLAGRMDIMHRRMDRAAQGDVARMQPSAYAPLIAYDTIVHAPKALRFLADLVGLDRLALGTDYSFPPADESPMEGLRTAGLTPIEIETIVELNPRRIFPRLAAA